MGTYAWAFGPHDAPRTYVGHAFDEHELDTGAQEAFDRPLRVALAQGRTAAVSGEDIPVVTRLSGNALRAFVRSTVQTRSRDALEQLLRSTKTSLEQPR